MTWHEFPDGSGFVDADAIAAIELRENPLLGAIAVHVRLKGDSASIIRTANAAGVQPWRDWIDAIVSSAGRCRDDR